MIYTPGNWYWTVAGSTSQVYSSARAVYVPVTDVTYQSWLAAGGIATRIDTEANLWDVLAAVFPAGIAVGNAAAQGQLKDIKISAADQTMLTVLFNHENRIRALEGKAAVSKAQFLTALKALL